MHLIDHEVRVRREGLRVVREQPHEVANGAVPVSCAPGLLPDAVAEPVAHVRAHLQVGCHALVEQPRRKAPRLAYHGLGSVWEAARGESTLEEHGEARALPAARLPVNDRHAVALHCRDDLLRVAVDGEINVRVGWPTRAGLGLSRAHGNAEVFERVRKIGDGRIIVRTFHVAYVVRVLLRHLLDYEEALFTLLRCLARLVALAPEASTHRRHGLARSRPASHKFDHHSSTRHPVCWPARP